MPVSTLSIVEEVESALSSSSDIKALETLERVADLYLSSAGQYAADQVEIFDKVLERLVKTIEIRAIADISARVALAELSARLAHVSRAPPSAVRQLARNDDISIAEPVLKESACLTAEDLVEIARLKSERHLLAIASRWWLKEVVTDVLLARDFPSVSRRIINNPGAKISAAGFAILVAQAEADPELAVETGLRVDLPPKLRDQLLRKATETVHARLLSSAPPHLFEEIRNAIEAVAAGVGRDMSKTYDFSNAARFVALLEEKGELNEGALRGFAKQRRYEDTIVALARLSKSSVEVVRPLMQSMRHDGILVACKAAELGWDTVTTILNCRYMSGSASALELTKAQEQFAAMNRETAQRLLRFWQVRTS
ncbi:DUF2336 domain-containing protein [Bradyrhizobium sp.]|uniref:DUF2336 domain-containing protein n=1 Tax=Bradyrhizobium sp. TaxID=376 RepID=UPI0026350A95|nr:DUF2336 domain-containing protein [Bradyrhizobium sp.]